MPEIDLTITISVIVALCAIISPIFTTIINNRHLLKLEESKQKQKLYENTTLHKREIFENYMMYAGQCIYYADANALKDYGKYYFPALMHAPSYLRPDMIKANQLMQQDQFDDVVKLFEKISLQLNTIIQMP